MASYFRTEGLLQVSFPDKEWMAAAASHLMKCHPHHFAVTPDNGFSLLVSPTAVMCLKPILDQSAKVN